MTGREAVILVSLSAGLLGCANMAHRAGRPGRDSDLGPPAATLAVPAEATSAVSSPPDGESGTPESDEAEQSNIALVSLESTEPSAAAKIELLAAPPVEVPPPSPPVGADPDFALDAVRDQAVPPDAERVLSLEEVVASVRSTYPLLIAAFEGRDIAAGLQLEAWGEFDLKAKAGAIAQPLGFYENYQYFAGLEQPTYWGGQVFTNYKLGRGFFEPWFKERQTNEGGELSAGIAIPFGQGHDIDPRRAELWKATYGRTLTEFDIQTEGIGFILGASMLYWEWVAAGETVRLSEALLELARSRVGYLERQIEQQRLPEIARIDNRRLIVSREAQLIESRQKLQQSAIKLSLFLREPDGTPIIPPAEWLPAELPEPEPFDPALADPDVQVALANRPELRQLAAARSQIEVDLAIARNQIEPVINGLFLGSQDVGGAANRPDDKGPFVLEAGLTVDVPLQRRKGRGKMQAVEGKLAQNAAKIQYTGDKIVTDVQSVNVALAAAYEQYKRAVEAVELNRRLEQAEFRRLQVGQSNLLLLNLREQATFDAQLAAIGAWLEYFQARATRRAVLAVDAALFTGPATTSMGH